MSPTTIPLKDANIEIKLDLVTLTKIFKIMVSFACQYLSSLASV